MIDTHQHLLYPDRFTYSWTRDFSALSGAFTLEKYQQEAAGCGITGTLFMEVDVDAEFKRDETAFFCELCEQPGSGLVGVIGGLNPGLADFREDVKALNHRSLKGIRRVLHTQPDSLLEQEILRKNLQWLGSAGLSFDLVVKQSQLSRAADLVRFCPDTLFILDHCGSPVLFPDPHENEKSFRDWQENIQILASLPNVLVKYSGLSTYIPDECRHNEILQPYVDTLLSAFGPGRMVWGSDWPVVNLGEGLAGWCRRSRELLAGLEPGLQKRIFEENAKTVYKLNS